MVVFHGGMEVISLTYEPVFSNGGTKTETEKALCSQPKILANHMTLTLEAMVKQMKV